MIDFRAVEERLAAVRDRIRAACERAGRDPDGVRLIGVTKEMPVEAAAAAVAAGLTDLGENHVQELETKRDQVAGATWHLIGRVQGNKARRAAEAADVVHTLEPGRALERMAATGAGRGRAVPGLVEVDFTDGRVGVPSAEAEVFVDRVAAMEGIDLRGLMTVAPPGGDPGPAFAALRDLRDRLAARHPGLVELSMGMSADLETAVEEGATMVRVGSAIFGPRR